VPRRRRVHAYRPHSNRTACPSSIPVGRGEALADSWNGEGRSNHCPHGRPGPPHPSSPTEPQKENAGLDFRITVTPALAAPGLFNTAFRRWRSRLPGSTGWHRRNAYCFYPGGAHGVRHRDVPGRSPEEDAKHWAQSGAIHEQPLPGRPGYKKPSAIRDLEFFEPSARDPGFT